MNRVLPMFCLLCLLACNSREQAPATAASAPPQTAKEPEAPLAVNPLYRQLYEAHETYREPAIGQQRFKQVDIEPLILHLKAPFDVHKAGQSIEGRGIYLVKLGNGPKPVLLWSQMHGDEPTATMALLDIFNFFSASDGFDDLRRRLLNELTLYFIPMLNPDGAEKFKRRNAIDIDLNRDALRLQCPEARLLKKVRDETQAQWGFNLHDQSRYYGAGYDNATASISFLAPAYNLNKDINEVRGNAMQLIALLNQSLQEFIPDKVARYDDEFEPRAFGDNIQKWGTSTILIESGGLADDPEKQELRRLNFTILLAAFDAIASGSYEQANIQDYEKIPFNNNNAFHDLIIREAQLQKNGQWYTVDLGFRHNQADYNSYTSYYPRATLADIGDLSTFHAYESFDARGYRIVPGRTYGTVLPNLSALRRLDLTALLRQGYTVFQLQQQPKPQEWAEIPAEITKPGSSPANEIRLNGNPSFLLQKDGAFHYAVVNGFIYSLAKGAERLRKNAGG
ncbi:MAG: hypothetical protein KDC66_16185 [Phaeodactylibacter sp.]|nr:hypothetical protein [Phaeodactylibacter sp.]